ncbi:MAG: formylglycine-generating enzyme family protein, partial [Anaerolineaceae bacterium]|nr:formylglycine-generating enzyme family protein [Anaerolineaceae bacterium]
EVETVDLMEPTPMVTPKMPVHAKQGAGSDDARKKQVILPTWALWMVGAVLLVMLLVVGASLLSRDRRGIPTASAEPTDAAVAMVEGPIPADMDSPAQTLADPSLPSPKVTEASIPTSTPTSEPTFGIGSRRVNPADDELMVYVPEGEFMMGSQISEASENEKPQHLVYLDAFWIYRTAVTNKAYRICVEEGICSAPSNTYYFADPSYADHPVVYVNWFDAAAYCQWAGGRLPTEAEWEKAARGTDGRNYPWGNSPVTGDKANFCDVNCQNSWAENTQNDGYENTAPVGSYPAGASFYDALDMAGNVWEWVTDWYDEAYYNWSLNENPTGPSVGTTRVLRGGSWYDQAKHIRVSYRGRHVPDESLMDYGFRCVVLP